MQTNNIPPRRVSVSLGMVARWLALRLTLPLMLLLLSACNGQGGMPGSIGEFNQAALNFVLGLWGTVFICWIAGLAFWLGAFAIQGYWDAPWQKVSGWGRPALIYGSIGQVVMGVLYGLAVTYLNGYTGR